MSRSKAIRAAAWTVVAAGVLAPLVRKRVKAPPVVMQSVAFAAPAGLCVAVRRSRARDIAVCALQMWAYLAAYETPLRRPRAPARTGSHRLPDRGRPRPRARRAAHGPPATRARPRGPGGAGMAHAGRCARVDALDLVPGPAHGARCTSCCATRALPARGRDDLCGVRPRRVRLLGPADRSAVVCRLARRGERPADRRRRAGARGGGGLARGGGRSALAGLPTGRRRG